MFIVKCKPQPVLAIRWEGNNLEEVQQLFPFSSVSRTNKDLLITDEMSENKAIPLSWFIVKYGGKAIAFSTNDFMDLFEDYFNPHERYNVSSDSDELKEVESSNPDPEFMAFL